MCACTPVHSAPGRAWGMRGGERCAPPRCPDRSRRIGRAVPLPLCLARAFISSIDAPTAPPPHDSSDMHSHTRPLPLSFPNPSPQPLKKPKSAKGELDENDLAFLAKKKAEAAALKEFKEKNAKKK